MSEKNINKYIYIYIYIYLVPFCPYLVVPVFISLYLFIQIKSNHFYCHITTAHVLW